MDGRRADRTVRAVANPGVANDRCRATLPCRGRCDGTQESRSTSKVNASSQSTAGAASESINRLPAQTTPAPGAMTASFKPIRRTEWLVARRCLQRAARQPTPPAPRTAASRRDHLVQNLRTAAMNIHSVLGQQLSLRRQSPESRKINTFGMRSSRRVANARVHRIPAPP